MPVEDLAAIRIQTAFRAYLVGLVASHICYYHEINGPRLLLLDAG